MGTFMNNLKVDEAMQNKVTVTWAIIDRAEGLSPEPLRSPPFTLFSDGYLVPFCLLIDDLSPCDSEFSVKVRKNIPTVGRAIVTLSVRYVQTPDFLRTQLIEQWDEDYVFNSFFSSREWRAILEKSYRCPATSSCIVVQCSITWLGFSQPPDVERITDPTELCIPKLPYENKLMSNVKIIIGSEELTAQKNVLTLHSPFFSGMFETPMEEAQENHVVIEGIEFSTMDTLLKILHSGKTDELNDVQMALKILAAADKYQMMMIKRACEYKLQLSVRKDNVLKLLDEADKFNAEKLCQTCVEYIIADRKIIPPKLFEVMCLNRANLAKALINTQIKKLYSVPSNNPSLVSISDESNP